MNCGICKAHLRSKNPCHGCNIIDRNIAKHCSTCHIRNCQERKGKFCFNCNQFPCKRIIQLDKRYIEKYGMSEINNLEYIRENGITKFIKRERENWQSQKGILCVHDKKFY